MVVNTHPIKLIKFLFYLLVISFFIQSSSYAIKYKVTEKEYIERCYDWDIYRTSFCPFPVELKHLCDDCRYDGEGKDQKDGNIIPNGSGNFSNIVIESFIPPNPNPSSEDDFDFQIFVTETLCIAEGTCHRYVRPRVPIISVADIEPEPEVKTNNKNDRTRYDFNLISFEPPSQNWNFNNEHISRGFAYQYGAHYNSYNPTGRDLERVFHKYVEDDYFGFVRDYRVNVKEDVRDDGGNITGFNINTYRADIDKSTVTFMITTEANNTYTLTFTEREFRGMSGVMSGVNFGKLNTKEWSEEFLDGSPAVNVAFVGRNVVKAELVKTNFHEIQNSVNQETVKVGEVETVKEVEIKVEKKDVKVPQNLNEVLISMGAPSAKQKEFTIDEDLLYPAKIATDALILNYNGEFKNGVPHGNGTVSILNPKTNLKYGLYGDYKINLSGTFKYGVFKQLNEIYYPISGEVFKFTKGVKPYESEFTRNILHGACLGKCKKIKISLDNINLGKAEKKFKNMPAISSKLISQTQLFANNTPTILSTHATIEMEDNNGNILPTLGINLPPLAKTSLFTLPGYNNFSSEDYININDTKKVKELKLNILNLKKINLEKNVNFFLQNSAIKDRKELIKETKKISKKYKISPNRFLQNDLYEFLSNDKAHNNQPMTVNYTQIIKELAENTKFPIGSFRIGYDFVGMSGLNLGVSYEMQERDKVPIGGHGVYFSTHSSGMDKKVKIESKPKKYEVDNNFLKKSQSGNIARAVAQRAESLAQAQRADNDLVGGNVIANVFGVLGFAEQVINFLNNSRHYSNLELKTLDVNYLLKSMIEDNLPSNSSLDLEDEYVKQIFEKSNVEKLTMILEFFLRNYLGPFGSLHNIIPIIIKNCERNSVDCNIVDFLPYNNLYGIVSDDMKKIVRVVEASKSKKDDSGGDGGGDDGW